ncbi:MAG: prephenate dehydratase [Acidimicrobiia bacterium]|nr:prephenate dehydratase [Acidimicrobiia bacterium]
MSRRIGYMGPAGTNTHDALVAAADLAATDHVALASIREVAEAVEAGDVDAGVVPLENSLEGSVADTIDLLVFDKDLQIRREIVRPVDLHLVGRSGVVLDDVTEVVTYPVAAGQCRANLRKLVPNAQVVAANSTAEAAALVARSGGDRVAVSTRLAAEMSGLAVLHEDLPDHPGAETRFVLIGRGVPPATGYDKTSIAVFQYQDRPGSLLAILQEFAVRGLNLTRLESRPTRGPLGDYYFLIDIEGHLADALLADALRGIKYRHRSVKFLGSYPRARREGIFQEMEEEAAWAAAGEWVDDLGRLLDGGPDEPAK